MNYLEVFEQREIEMIITALQQKATRHKSNSKMIKNSGYGKSTTLDKADNQYRLYEEYQELCSKILENSI